MKDQGRHAWIIIAAAAVMAFALLFMLQVGAAQADGAIIYVDHAADGAATGLSWTDAYTDVQDALAAASGGDEIWVAAGVYTPGTIAEASFRLLDGVALYGGFAGVESERDARDPHAHVTVLSGDLEGNDVTTPDGVVTDTARISGRNAYHVVTGRRTDSTALLDGFTITAGQADGANTNDRGGGMVNYDSGPSLVNVTFSGNQADSGGGMYNDDNSSPGLVNVTFSGNQANFGGGMYNDDNSSPRLTNVIFGGNHATDDGGGMVNSSSSSPSLVNATFSGNQAGSDGGGMVNYSSNPTLTNCILWGNTAGSGGAQMYNGSSAPVVNYSLVAGGCPGEATCDAHLLATDPLFVDADGPDDVVGTVDDNLRLADGSPAIDAGNNAAVPPDSHDLDGDGDAAEPLPYDLAGCPRFVDHPQADTGAGLLPLVDMGAYETLGLWIDKVANAVFLDAGDRLTYTLTFSNHTELTATEVLITDVVPTAWVSAIGVISSGVAITDTGVSPAYVWQVEDLAPGQRGTITITGILSTSLAPGQSLTNTARAHAVFHGIPGVSAASATVTRYASADLALTKMADPTYLSAGDAVTYTVTLVNHGPVALAGVVSDTPPSAISVTSSTVSHGSCANGVWDVGGLAVGEVATLTIVGTVGGDTAARTFTNTAVLSASIPVDIITHNNAASAAVTINTPPEFTSTPVESGTVGLPYTYAVTARDADAGDALTFTAPVSATWLQLTQVTTHAASLSGTPNSVGDYPVELQVSDGQDSDIQAFTIRVSAPNQPPVADAGEDQTVATGSIVTLDGSGSTDPDGDLPLAYRWTQTNDPSVSFASSLSVTTFTAPATDAVLTFTLTVTDSLGWASAPDEVVVTVTSGPFPVLRVFKSVDAGGQEPVLVGSVVTYTIVISNSGTGVASGVVMTDPLPSGVSFGGWVGGHPGTVILPEPDMLDWRGDVDAEIEYRLVFTATVTSGAASGVPIVNTAYYRSDDAALQTASDGGFTVKTGYDVYLPLLLRNY